MGGIQGEPVQLLIIWSYNQYVFNIFTELENTIGLFYFQVSKIIVWK